MNRTTHLYVCLVFAIALAALPTFAQKVTGDIAGTVTDATGAVVANATVTAESIDTKLTRSGTTSATGAYRIPELPIGMYKLSVRVQGFKAVERQAEVAAAKLTTADFQLQIGSTAEVVTVEATAPLIEFNDKLNNTMDQQIIERIPISGLDFQALAALEPGVSRNPGGGFQTITVNGNRPDSNNYLVDGLYNNDRYYGDSAVGQTGIVGIPATLIPMDAIQEMTVQQAPSSEFGIKSGAPILVNLKSGSNAFHGSARWLRRTDATDATNYFSKHSGSGTKTPLKNNQFGGQIGGPILKDKLFFFGFYEGQRLNFQAPYEANVPTPTEILAARANIADAGMTTVPAGENLLAFYPTDPSGVIGVNIPTTAELDSFSVKVDYKLSDKQLLTGRYLFGDSLQSAGAFTGTLAPPPPNPPDMFNSVAPSRAQLIGFSHTWNLSSNKILESRLGMTRFSQIIDVNNKVNPVDLGIDSGPLDPADFGVPAVYYLADFGYIGGIAGYPITTRPNQTYDWSEHFSWIKGSHSMKMGGNFQHAYTNSLRNRARLDMEIFTSDDDPTVAHVNALTQLLLGRFNFIARSFGDTHRLISQDSYGFYFMDDWKVNRRLTLSYGLRYDISSTLKEERDRAVNFDPVQGLVQVGQGIDGLYDLDKNNFGPRFGFAWDVLGNGKTALRASYGLTYDVPNFGAIHAPRTGFSGLGARAGAYTQANLGIFSKSLEGDPSRPDPQPPVAPTDPTATCVDPVTGVGDYVCVLPGVPIFGSNPTGEPPFNAFSIVRNFKTPMMHNFHLSVQQEIAKNNVVTLAYVGTQGRNLLLYRDLNAPPIGCNVPDPDACDALRPFASQFPELNHIIQLNNDAKSWYDSMQVTYRQRDWHGLSTLSNFTWANCRDITSNNRGGGVQGRNFTQANNPYDPNEMRGPCDSDVRLNFTLGTNYALPKLGLGRVGDGWEVNSAFVAASGRPYSANLGGFDPSGQSVGAIRADWNGQPVQYNPRDPDHYIANPEIFSEPAPGTIGNSPRNLLRGPGFNQWDASVLKVTKLTERVSMQFRWEIFNLLNRANFGILQNNIERGTFGTINSTPDVDAINPIANGGPRNMQFGLKFIF